MRRAPTSSHRTLAGIRRPSPRACCSLAMRKQAEGSSRNCIARASPNDDDSAAMTEEEEAVLSQMLEARRQKKKADISEHKRRSKFDPLAARNKAEQTTANPAAAASQAQPVPAMQQRPAARKPLQEATVAAAVTAAPVRPQQPAAARRPPPPRPSLLSSVAPSIGDDDDAEDDDVDEDDDAGFEAAALQFLQEEESRPPQRGAASDGGGSQRLRPADGSVGSSGRPLAPPQPLRRRTIAAPGSFKPQGASPQPAAALGRATGPTAATLPATPSGRQAAGAAATSPGVRGAVAGRAGVRVSGGRGQAPPRAPRGDLSDLDGLSDAQLEAILADYADESGGGSGPFSPGGGGEAEELDWDTLAAGESFEKYLAEIQEEAEDSRVRRERDAARRKREGAAAGGVQPPSAAAGMAASALGAELLEGDSEEPDAELEQLLKLLEMVDEGDDGEATTSGSDAGAASSILSNKGVTAKSRAMEDAIDWGVLEKMFLGDGWDKEIQEMAAAGAAAGGSSAPVGGREEGGVDDEAPSWADEVTTLLLGLVGISHQCYLDKPLMDRCSLRGWGEEEGGRGRGKGSRGALGEERRLCSLGPLDGRAHLGMGRSCAVSESLRVGAALCRELTEEERAEVIWKAPFAVLVQDDSKEAMLEYANSKVSDCSTATGHNRNDIMRPERLSGCVV